MIVITLARRGAAAALALAWLLGAGSAAAQQPTPSAIVTAKELLIVKGATGMFDAVIPGMVESTKNTFLPTNPGLYKEINQAAAKVQTEFASRRTEVIDEIARLYAQHFTEAEMKEVIAFYKTPTGRKLVADEPAIIQQGLARADAWSKKMADEVMSRFRAEMKKMGHDL